MSASAFFAGATAATSIGGSLLPSTAAWPASQQAALSTQGRCTQRAAPGASAAAPAAPPAAPSPPDEPLPAFPSSRTHLWDRSPAGAVTVIDLKVRGGLAEGWPKTAPSGGAFQCRESCARPPPQFRTCGWRCSWRLTHGHCCSAFSAWKSSSRGGCHHAWPPPCWLSWCRAAAAAARPV